MFYEFRQKIKYAWQRVFRRYDDLAKWNSGSYICKTAHELIKWNKENFHGYPAAISGMPEKYTQEDEQKWESEWYSILDKIEYSFKVLHDVAEDKAIIDYGDMSESNKAMYIDLNMYIVPIKDIEDGLKLFAKWAPNIWD